METTIGVFPKVNNGTDSIFITREIFPNSLILANRNVLYRGYYKNKCIIESNNLFECVDRLNLISNSFYDMQDNDSNGSNEVLLALYSDKIVKKTRGRVSKRNSTDTQYRLVGIYDSLFYFISCLLDKVNVYNDVELEKTLLNIVLFYNRYLTDSGNNKFKLFSSIKGVSIDSNNNDNYIKIGNFTIIPYSRNNLNID